MNPHVGQKARRRSPVSADFDSMLVATRRLLWVGMLLRW